VAAPSSASGPDPRRSPVSDAVRDPVSVSQGDRCRHAISACWPELFQRHLAFLTPKFFIVRTRVASETRPLTTHSVCSRSPPRAGASHPSLVFVCNSLFRRCIYIHSFVPCVCRPPLMEASRPKPPIVVAPLADGVHNETSSSSDEEEGFGTANGAPRHPLRVWPMTDASSRRTWSRLPDSDPAFAPDSLSGVDDHGRARGRWARFVLWVRSTGTSSWVNGLLIFVPLGIASYMLHLSPILVFVLNGVAIIPLSALLTDATEKISSDAGDTVGALLNISLGNLVELIIL